MNKAQNKFGTGIGFKVQNGEQIVESNVNRNAFVTICVEIHHLFRNLMGQVLVVFAEIYDQSELIYRTGLSFSKVKGAEGICEGVENFPWGLFFFVMSHESALFLPI